MILLENDVEEANQEAGTGVSRVSLRRHDIHHITFVIVAWAIHPCGVMGSEIQRSKSGRSQKWLTKMPKRAQSSNQTRVSDGSEDFGDDSFTNISARTTRAQECTLTHELRLFVGTWNVAGRPPACSLAADLDEWLNLKSEVDIYVLGFQEIVPLNTRTVIGVEDQTEATKWNLLIGKTLNRKEDGVWLTTTMNPITIDDYEYVKAPNSGRKAGISRSTTPMRERSKPRHGEMNGNSTYKLMASKKMVGVFISIWMRRELLRKYNISNVKVSSVACGIMGCLGNKGSVSVSVSIEKTSFCFIVAHLASGEKKGDEGRRNQQVSEIFKRSTYPRLSQENDTSLPLTILGHDLKFWFGDLNYRLNLEDNLARDLILKRNWTELQKFDQLRRERELGGVFQGWKEGNIEFAPTYKYVLSNSNRYSGSIPTKSGEKQRTPAWCDRILWHGKGIQQLSYICGVSNFSDHRPVSAVFTTEIEVQSTNPRAVALSKFLSSMNLSRLNLSRLSIFLTLAPPRLNTSPRTGEEKEAPQRPREGALLLPKRADLAAPEITLREQERKGSVRGANKGKWAGLSTTYTVQKKSGEEPKLTLCTLMRTEEEESTVCKQ
ncbi:hypothetical protein Ancab_034673 [Ancistrocladus abbreviatus]